MADQFSYTMDFEGILKGVRGRRFGVMKPLVMLLAMERAIYSAGRVVVRTTTNTIRWRLRAHTGNLLTNMRVRGSAAPRFIPSARIAGAPHLHLIEHGHRIFSRGKDTGKRTRAFKVVATGLRRNIAGQTRAIQRTMNRELEKVQFEAVSNSLDSEAKAERYVRRLLKQDERSRRLYGSG